jgi:hypothetical protein
LVTESEIGTRLVLLGLVPLSLAKTVLTLKSSRRADGHAHAWTHVTRGWRFFTFFFFFFCRIRMMKKDLPCTVNISSTGVVLAPPNATDSNQMYQFTPMRLTSLCAGGEDNSYNWITCVLAPDNRLAMCMWLHQLLDASRLCCFSQLPRAHDPPPLPPQWYAHIPTRHHHFLIMLLPPP